MIYSDDDDILPTIHENDTATCNSSDDRVEILSQFGFSFFLSLSLHSTKELYHNILYGCMIACIVHNWISPQPQKNSGSGLYILIMHQFIL